MATKIISNKPYTLSEYFRKLVKHSFLIAVLSKRELKIKYSKTFLGLGWLVLQPLVAVIIYSVFFNNLIKIDTNTIPYPYFVFSGLVLWYIFTGIVSKCTYAMLESSDLINKVSFPRFIVLISKIIPVVLESALLLLVLFIILIFNRQHLGFNSLTSFFYFVQIIVFSFGIGTLFSIVAIRFRDLIHVLPFIINFGIWLTPVFYPVTIIPSCYQDYVKYLNPMALSMEGIRGALFFDRGISKESFGIFVVSCGVLFLSFYYFVKFEKKIVEKI
jgi:lipopolysaccharide transport system permease protein